MTKRGGTLMIDDGVATVLAAIGAYSLLAPFASKDQAGGKRKKRTKKSKSKSHKKHRKTRRMH